MITGIEHTGLVARDVDKIIHSFCRIDFTEEAIDNYYKQFISGNYQSIETNFNKTGYIDKMNGNKYLIREGKDFLNIEGDNNLYVFFYNENTEMEVGGYIPLTKVLEFVNQKFFAH